MNAAEGIGAIRIFAETLVQQARSRPWMATALVLGLIAVVWVFWSASESTLRVVVVDGAGNVVSLAQVTMETPLFQSRVTDAQGTAVFNWTATGPKQARFVVSKEGFDTLDHTVVIDVSRDIELVIRSSNVAQTVSLVFAGMDNKSISGHVFKGVFSCANPLVTPTPSAFEVRSQDTVSTVVPPECGGLVLSMQAPSEFAGFSYAVLPTDRVVKLQTQQAMLAGETAQLTVYVDETTMANAPKLDVWLFQNGRRVSQTRIQNGRAVLDLAPASWAVLVSDATGQYGSVSQENITLRARQKTDVHLTLAPAQTQAMLTVVDERTQAALSGAVVVLSSDSQVLPMAIGYSDTSGIVKLGTSLPIPDDARIEVFLNGFEWKVLPWHELVVGAPISLLMAGSENTLEIIVRDAVGNTIENAQVYLADETAKPWQGLPLLATDASGKAVFRGIQGRFEVMAVKGVQTGHTMVDVSSQQSASAQIVLSSPQETGRIRVQSLRGPVLEAHVALLDLSGNVLWQGTTQANGEVRPMLLAGQPVVTRISHPQFSPFESESRLVSADFDWIFSLRSRADTNRLLLELIEVQNAAGETVSYLQAGQSYTARLLLQMPAGLSQAGVFVSAGTAVDISQERVGISALEAGRASVVMGKTLSVQHTSAQDLAAQNLQFGFSKWAQAQFETPSQGSRQIQVRLDVLSDALPQSGWTFGYRAWGVSENGVLLDPSDDRVSLQASADELLYAARHETEFEIVQTQVACVHGLCLRDLRFEQQDIVQTIGPFVISSGLPARLTWSISNETAQSQSFSMRLVNRRGTQDAQVLSMDAFTQNGDAVELNGLFETQTDMELTAGASAAISLQLQVAQPLDSQYAIELWQNDELIDRQIIEFEIFAVQAIQLEATPLRIAPLYPATLRVQARDSQTGMPRSDIVIELTRKSSDASKSTQTQPTDIGGLALFEMPSLPPDTNLYIIQAGDATAPPLEITTGPLFSFLPPRLETFLSVPDRLSQTIQTKIQNNSGTQVRVAQNGWNGPFEGTLNTQQLSESLQSWQQSLFSPLQSSDVSLTTTLLENTPAGAQERAGHIWIDAVAQEDTYRFSVPLNVRITASAQNGGTSPQSCLFIRRTRWQGMTVSNRSDFAFVIENSCAASFDALEATIVWHSAPNGSVAIELSQSAPTTLTADQWTPVLAANARGTQEGHLTFTPSQDELGQHAQFTVYLAARSTRTQEVVFSTPISADLLATNLESCLDFTPSTQRGVVMAFESPATITMDISRCTGMRMTVELCADDPGCSGGTIEGKISVTPAVFELSEENPRQEIKIEAVDLPGAYDIPVWISDQSGEFTRVATFPVTVQLPAGESMQLEKFSYFLPEIGATDDATLVNHALSTQVRVQARAADWATLSAADIDAYLASGEGMFSQEMDDLNAALMAAHLQAAEQARQTAQKVEEAQGLAEQALSSQNQAAQATDQAGQQIASALNLADTGTAYVQQMTTNCQPLNACAVRFSVCVTAEAEAARICSGAQSLWSSMANAVGGPLKAANDAINQAINKMGNALFPDSGAGIPSGPHVLAPKNGFEGPVVWFAALQTPHWARAHFQLGDTAVSTASEGLTQINSAERTAAVTDSDQISAGARSAGEFAAQSCLQNQNAASLDQQAQQDTAQASGNMTATVAGLGQNAAQTAVFEGAINSSPCLSGCAAEITAMRTPFYSFKGVQTSLQGGATAASQTTDTQATPSQFDAELASTAASTAACATSEDLEAFATASEQLADDIAGAHEQTIKDLATQLGSAVTSGYLDGIYLPDDEVENVLSAYVTNLKRDAVRVNVDSSKVAGRFETSHAQVSGEFESQTVGIVFENQSLEEETAFGVVSMVFNVHQFDDILRIPPDYSNWGPYNLDSLSATTQRTVKFHAKFSGTTTATPSLLSPTAVQCQTGTLVGYTGNAALPRIKLRWNWTDITLNTCDASNPDYSYCDATQFSIMVTKRLQAINEFLKVNSALQCPPNRLSDQLDAQMAGFNALPNGGSFSASEHMRGCWLPKTTRFFDGQSALSHYVAASDTVFWTQEIPDLETLDQLLSFDAYLIQDGYSTDFKSDFAQYFSEIAFLDTPQYFFNAENNRNFNAFFTSDAIFFEQKFANGTRLPTSGKYAVNLEVNLTEDAWNLFDSTGKPAAQINVKLESVKTGEADSPFYYIPFNGAVGTDGARLHRDGYGTQFILTGTDTFLISRNENTVVFPSDEAGAFSDFSLQRVQDFARQNSLAQNRGFIFDLTQNATNVHSAVFSPTLATPVLLRVTQSTTPSPFASVFSLRQSDAAKTPSSNLSFWQSATSCTDFDSTPLSARWVFEPDRRAQASDRVLNFENAYALSWPNAPNAKSVHLKSVFFTPVNTSYSLRAESDNTRFISPDSPESPTVRLTGISSMPFNRQGTTATDSISALDDLFALVEQQVVCVTNTGVRTSFWWNPATLYEHQGLSGESISSLARAAENEAFCRQ